MELKDSHLLHMRYFEKKCTKQDFQDNHLIPSPKKLKDWPPLHSILQIISGQEEIRLVHSPTLTCTKQGRLKETTIISLSLSHFSFTDLHFLKLSHSYFPCQRCNFELSTTQKSKTHPFFSKTKQPQKRNMFFNTTQIPSAKTIVSAAASAAATVALVRKLARDYLPYEVQTYLFLKLRDFISGFSNELTLVIEKYDDGLNRNKLFRAAKLYLEPKIPPYVRRIKIHLPKREAKVSLSVEKNEEIVDKFNGVYLTWRSVSKRTPSKVVHGPNYFGSKVRDEGKYFELSFHRKHKDMILEKYIPHIMKKSAEINKEKKTLKLHTLRYDLMHGRKSDVWQSVNLDHPATFDTLAMDSNLKKKIMEDLERFVKRKEFYRRVGKAWKRGYLLFGPPGTGKSSLIAAMANYLKFDIYDLELASVWGNSGFRKLLVTTENKSILVVEDIDCSLELQDRLAQANKAPVGLNQATEVTLSGLLNFLDGLWSSCGDERIIIFTTNHKHKLDPALLRPGRMDVHIHMSYCTPFGFKVLASNYLGITEHPLFTEIEELIEETKVTPAEIAEQLMRDEEVENALRCLIEFLEEKRENGENKAGEAEMVTIVEEGKK